MSSARSGSQVRNPHGKFALQGLLACTQNCYKQQQRHLRRNSACVKADQPSICILSVARNKASAAWLASHLLPQHAACAASDTSRTCLCGAGVCEEQLST